MEIVNGVEVGAEADVDLDSVDINGGTIDGTVVGDTTPAAGSFTALKASTDPVDAGGVGDRGFNDARYCLEANNLSDVGSAATSFGNIKQVATDSATGVSELATDAETVTGTATDRVVTPANITAKIAEPGAIGGTTPATGVFTTLEATSQLHGALINNQMVQKATFDILGLMTDPRFLNLLCENPGAGTMTDVSGQGHSGTYQGSMTSGDRVANGMGWSVDFDGIDDYCDLGDHNDFSFGDGTNDEAVTWLGVIEAIDTTSTQMVASKRDDTSGTEKREWSIYTSASRALYIIFHDESASVYCYRSMDSGMSVGYHSFVITSPGDGGATAMNNVKIYIDGVVVGSSATNSGTYVAMENQTTSCWIAASKDASGDPTFLYEGDISMVGIDGSEWSAFDVHRFHQLCKGLYSV